MSDKFLEILAILALLTLFGCSVEDTSGDNDTDTTVPRANDDDDDSAQTDDDDTAPAPDDDDDDECVLNPSDPSKYVIVGFWLTEDCSGEPVNTNAFPVDNEDGCYCWPGHSGANSATDFSCNPEDNSFTYQQYANLTCDASGNGTLKTSYTDQCLTDVPATLHARIIEYGACLK